MIRHARPAVKEAHPWKPAVQAGFGHSARNAPADGRGTNGRLSRDMPLPHLKGFDCACVLVTPHCAPDMQEMLSLTHLIHTWCITWRNDPAAPRHPTIDVAFRPRWRPPETIRPVSLNAAVLALCLPLSQAPRRTHARAGATFPNSRRGAGYHLPSSAHHPRRIPISRQPARLPTGTADG